MSSSTKIRSASKKPLYHHSHHYLLNKNVFPNSTQPLDPGGGISNGEDPSTYHPLYDHRSLFIHPSLIQQNSASTSLINSKNSEESNNNTANSPIQYHPDSWSLDGSCDSLEEHISSASSIPSTPNRYHSPHHTHNQYYYSSNYHRNSAISSNSLNPAWIKVKQSSVKSPDILTRPSWFDAETALNQIEKGKAYGNNTGLWLRFMIQARFFELGYWIHKRAGAIMFIASLILVVCLAGLKSVHIEDDVEKLWIEDGGRLEKELKYIRNTLGDGFGNTDQIIIQTPKYVEDSVLNSASLLFHLKVMRTAITTTVEMFDSTWNFKDICYTPSTPIFDKYHLDLLMDNIFPCSIITPLDCFWEGSKLLGPEIPVKIPGLNQNVQWTDFNPQQIVDMLIQMIQPTMMTTANSQNDISVNYEKNKQNPIETIQKFMKRAGISTAYQSKPCLDPMDLHCPVTAPNKLTLKSPNIGHELTDGCYGFATKYMHWIEDLIVGGVSKNRSGHIVRAKALQSIIQLMGEQNLFEYHQRTIKVQNVLDWSVTKARAILQAWQRKFSEELEQFLSTTDFEGSERYNVNHFTSTSLTDIMRNFTKVNFIRLGVGYLLMIAYAGFSLSRWRIKTVRMERSQSILGMLGVLIIGFAMASGLGLCALIGLPFNASTTQIIPFLAVGLGIDNMFLLAHVYTTDYMIDYVPLEYRTAECLKQAGFNILLSSIGNVVAFCSAAIIPIPALRCFALQTAILIAIISIAVIILFPALASIDLRFRSMYLAETGRTSSQSSLSTSFFVNMCFYLFCCRTPHFRKVSSSTKTTKANKTLAEKSSSVPVSSQPGLFFKQPYLYKQPYNFVYLNSIQTTTDENHSFNAKKLSSDVNTTENDNICRCELKTNPGKSASSDEQSMMMCALMTRSCQKCGGELRTQCDGQDDDESIAEEFSETLPISPSTTSLSSTNQPQQQQQLSLCSPAVPPKHFQLKFSTAQFATDYLGPFLKRRPAKVLISLIYVVIMVFSIMGITKVNDGLDLTDLVPRSTNEYQFLELRKQYFTYYNMFVVTKGNFDYPNNQRILYEYHQSFNRIDAIIKNDDGGLPEFWLPIFRDWLKELQDAFDHDRERGCITRERWYSNASNEAILAYKLLVQTGRIDNPVDKSLVLTARLVDQQGIINPKAFYNYLTAWASNDMMAYDSTQASFKPEPRQWIHEANDVELKIPKSPPLIFTQIPFHLNNIRTTDEIIKTIQDVRAVCSRFENLGLPNFPTGIPFTYWEQYIRLRFYMMMALLAVLAGIFFSTSVLLCSLWTPMIIVFNLILNIVQLFGFMGWIGIKLSALPAVILIVSVGISLNSLIHITISFNSAIGSRNQRMIMALKQMASPVKHGIVSTLFGLLMLVFSEFDFILRYFFCVLVASLVIITFNSFILLPIILSMIGAKSEVIPLDHEDRISIPSIPPSPVPSQTQMSNLSSNRYVDSTNILQNTRRSIKPLLSTRSLLFNRYQQQRRELQRVQSQLSLSTISEEPSSYQSTPGITPTNTPTPNNISTNDSKFVPKNNANPQQSSQPSQHEFVVQPEFVVETTITNNNRSNTTTIQNNRSGSENGSISESPSPSSTDRDENSSSGSSSTSFNATTTLNNNSNSGENQSQTTVTTKVMATAKFSVELHTPSPTPSQTNSNKQEHLNPAPLSHLPPATFFSFPGANSYPQHSHYINPYYPAASAPGFFMMPTPVPYHHSQITPISIPQPHYHYHGNPEIICQNRNCLINCPPPSHIAATINSNTQANMQRSVPATTGTQSTQQSLHRPLKSGRSNWR